MIKSLGSSGRAILINAATVTLGFLVLLASSMVPLRNFGLMIALTMVVSALAALTLLPVLVIVTRLRLGPNSKAAVAQAAVASSEQH